MTTLVNPFVSFPPAGGGGGGTLTLVHEGEAFPTNSTAVSVNMVGATGNVSGTTIASGDKVVVWVAADKTPAITAPTAAGGGAFTLDDAEAANSQCEGRWYSKDLAAGDTTISLPGDSNFNGKRYQYWVIHSTTAVANDSAQIAQGTDASGTNTTASWDNATPSVNGCMVLLAESNRASGSAFTGAPGGFTAAQNNPGGYYSCWAGHQLQTTATSVAALTITNTAASNGRWVAGISVWKGT